LAGEPHREDPFQQSAKLPQSRQFNVWGPLSETQVIRSSQETGRFTEANCVSEFTEVVAWPILDIPGAAISDRGVADVAAAALKRLTSPGSSEEPRGFWIHLDADVINPTVMPAGFSRTRWADNTGTGRSFDAARPPPTSAWP
jgi:hypothetical protein